MGRFIHYKLTDSFNLIKLQSSDKGIISCCTVINYNIVILD